MKKVRAMKANMNIIVMKNNKDERGDDSVVIVGVHRGGLHFYQTKIEFLIKENEQNIQIQ